MNFMAHFGFELHPNQKKKELRCGEVEAQLDN